jgi:hypothetical protein
MYFVACHHVLLNLPLPAICSMVASVFCWEFQ